MAFGAHTGTHQLVGWGYVRGFIGPVQRVVRFPPLLSHATGALGPPKNLSPVPDECGFECRYRLGKVGVTSTPLVNNLGAFHTQSLRDLVCANEIG